MVYVALHIFVWSLSAFGAPDTKINHCRQLIKMSGFCSTSNVRFCCGCGACGYVGNALALSIISTGFGPPSGLKRPFYGIFSPF